MGLLTGILTVFFFIVCALLIIIILLQSDKSAGMGILGGSSQTTFGSSTADVITKITTVFVAIFMFGALGISVLESVRARSYDPTSGEAVKVQNVQPASTADESKAAPADVKGPATAAKAQQSQVPAADKKGTGANLPK